MGEEKKEKYLAEERYCGPKVMAPQNPFGLPRKEIKWYPTINHELCTGSTAVSEIVLLYITLFNNSLHDA
jgi:hypothetical protein